MTLNIDFVRRQFPALSGDWVFFDNAGGSQTLKSVVDRINEYLLTSDVQLGASYAVSELAGSRVEEATRAMAALVNAADPSEIIMGTSTSMLLRNLALSLVRQFSAGDEVIVTNVDHEANIGPWVEMERAGIKVKTWQLNPESLELEKEDLEKLISDRTRLVAVTHVSNVLGTINPIREYASLAHAHGAMICVDGVAAAPHQLIDVRALDVDFYAFSFYKVYGPHHALLYARREHLENMVGINHFFIQESPYKLQPGGVNYELTYGMMGLCDYFREFARAHGPNGESNDLRTQASAVFEVVAEHEQQLSKRLLDYLVAKKNVRIIGKPTGDRDVRVPTISFVVDGRDSESVPTEVDPHKIGIRFGHFYAKRLIDDLGLGPQNGVVRVSMVHYNTIEEVDRLIGVLDHIL